MLLWLYASVASAEVSVLIVLPGDGIPEFAPYETSLRSELLASGYSVMTLQVPSAPGDDELAALADTRASAAAIVVGIDQAGVPRARVWMRDATHARTLLRDVGDSQNANDEPGVFAVRATDVLHGGLLELGYPPRRTLPMFEGASSAASASSEPAPPAPSASATPSAHGARARPRTAEVPSPPRPPPPPAPAAPHPVSRWAVIGGATGLWAPGGIPFGGAPTLGIGFAPDRELSLELSLVGPAWSRVSYLEEAALLDQELGLFRIALERPLGGRLSLRGALGGGLRRIGVRGRASPNAISAAGETWSVVGWAAGGVRLRLARPLWVRAELGPAVDSRTIDILFLGQTGARIRNPSVLGQLTLELSVR